MDVGEFSRLLLRTVTLLQRTSGGPESHERRLKSVGGSQALFSPRPPLQPPFKCPPWCLCFGLLKTFSKLTLASWPEP